MKYKEKNSDRRNNIQIYGDILDAINQESPSGKIRTTRIQTISNLSSNKLKSTLAELEKKGLVSSNPISIKEKGRKYIDDYNKMKSIINEIDTTYIENNDSDMIVGLDVDSQNNQSKFMILHEHEKQKVTQFKFQEGQSHNINELRQITEISKQILKLLNKESFEKNKNLVKLDILIIDDNKAITTMLSQFFSLKGHKPVEDNNGDSGLNKIMTGKYDYIILDLSMPKLNGLDVINNLHKKGMLPYHKIIVLTASEPDKKIINQLNARNIPVLKKPIDMKELEKLIEE